MDGKLQHHSVLEKRDDYLRLHPPVPFLFPLILSGLRRANGGWDEGGNPYEASHCDLPRYLILQTPFPVFYFVARRPLQLGLFPFTFQVAYCIRGSSGSRVSQHDEGVARQSGASLAVTREGEECFSRAVARSKVFPGDVV